MVAGSLEGIMITCRLLTLKRLTSLNRRLNVLW